MFSRAIFALIAIAVLGLPTPASAQTKPAGQYPNKPIRLIVPFTPGGTNDVLARMVGTHLSQTLGENVIVDNRPGGEGLIGTETAARSLPDAYTILLGQPR